MLGIFSFSQEKFGRVKVSKMSSTPILSGKKQVSRKHVVAAVAGEFLYFIAIPRRWVRRRLYSA